MGRHGAPLAAMMLKPRHPLAAPPTTPPSPPPTHPQLEAQLHPITRTVLRIQLTITPAFNWKDRREQPAGQPRARGRSPRRWASLQ